MDTRTRAKWPASGPQPQIPQLLGKDPCNQVFVAIPDASSSQLSGFSGKPMHDNQSVHGALKHHDAIHSAIVNDNKTANFMFLPCWANWSAAGHDH